ncbi:VanW family protein [Desulfosporosinus sp. BICA1-9]|uniref:VanW family protein n=1 Tax=Desulfosporosinus sp. BICA1-9 TaxID=1531958 RepID=UPI000ACFA747|nr:VanW family protein [Desulfosporosinus sp. BICA1-9]HBW37137.1 vancomycin resistance protein [Desulfosporosinus sp.]
MKESQHQRARSHEEVAVSEVYERNQSLGKSFRNSISRLFRIKAVKITLGLLFILFGSAGLYLLFYSWDHHLIVEGVKISGVNVSNLSEKLAREAMDKEIHRLKNQTIQLELDEFSHEVTLEELGLIVSAESALKLAYDYGRSGSLKDKVFSKMSASNGIELDLEQDWNETKLVETINKNFAEFNKLATDASFMITPQNTMLIKGEQVGRMINTEALIQKIKGINVYKPGPEIRLEFKSKTPLLTASQLEEQKITGLLSTYTTRFDSSQTARSENVRLAAKALDGAIIKPDGTLSFNQIVGERTVEAGYLDAYIIVNGQFVPGLAGGICQVSSTLYNTGILANLSVTQRSNHDLAISYVPLGQDATVAFPDLDLKFLNNTGGYLLVRTKLGNNTITIELYGKVNPGQEVVIANTIESVIPFVEERLVDETLARGQTLVKQEGQQGYIVNTTRTVKVNGQVIKAEPLKKSRYQPLPKITAIGA